MKIEIDIDTSDLVAGIRDAVSCEVQGAMRGQVEQILRQWIAAEMDLKKAEIMQSLAPMAHLRAKQELIKYGFTVE